MFRHESMILWGCALIALGCGRSSAPGNTEHPWIRPPFLNIAHAGGEFEAPTNTLFAMKRALANGANMLEFDLQRSADGHLVVVHDDTVDRVSNATGPVASFSLEQLRGLDKAYWFRPNCESGCSAEFPYRGIATGEKAPPSEFEPRDFSFASLEDVLALFPDTPMSIEIKGSPETGALQSAADLARQLREAGRTHDVIMGSFYGEVVREFRRLAPEVSTSPATLEAVRWWIRLGRSRHHEALQIPPYVGRFRTATPKTVARAHANGLGVIVWFSDRWERDGVFEPLVHDLLDAGVDGIITARPKALDEILAERAALENRPL